MQFENWGLIDYETSVARQLAAVDEIASSRGEERVVLCTHPPVVTLGRGVQADDVNGWTGQIIESTRGGRATYHGPNQVVVYPLLDLKRPHKNFVDHDVHAYLRALENATVQVLNEIGLPRAEARTSKVGEVSLTGVWVGEHKVASIGIAVRKWVTYHGVAINVQHDAEAFSGIRPCGFEPSVMSSVETELHKSVNRAAFEELVQRVFCATLKDQ